MKPDAINASRSPAGRAASTTARAPDDPALEQESLVESEGGQPIYQQVAAKLRRSISEGRYPVGVRLPTEIELCEQFGISRFTARAAVRLLSTAGLVTRRQRVGTVVIALPGDARYSHDVRSVHDLLQYALDTELRLVYVGKVALTKALAKDLAAEAGEEWTYAMGIRHDTPTADPGRKNSRPICITRIFLNPKLKHIESKLRGRKTAIYSLIEREYKVSIQRVEQELQGVVLDVDDAANLKSEPGAPALRIVRRYYSEQGVLLEMADNIHPSDRFSYHMKLLK